MRASIAIEFSELEEHLKKVGIKGLRNIMSGQCRAVKATLSLPYDNSANMRIRNIYGDEFVFTIDRKEPILFLWNHGGNKTVGCYEVPKELEQIRSDMNLYSQGLVRCASCKEPTSIHDPGGQYFAGLYCRGCWEGTKGKMKDQGGFRALEARETYN